MPTISVSGMLPSSHAGKIDIKLTDNQNSTIRVSGSHHETIQMQGSRYLVKDFSPPWLKSTRQRAKLKGRDRPASGTLP